VLGAQQFGLDAIQLAIQTSDLELACTAAALAAVPLARISILRKSLSALAAMLHQSTRSLSAPVHTGLRARYLVEKL